MIGRHLYRSLSASTRFITRRNFNAIPPGSIGGGRRKTSEFSVDRTGLIEEHGLPTLEENKQTLFLAKQGLDDKYDKAQDDEVEYVPPKNKETMSELAKDLHAYISVKGPISIHDYMLQCSNHFVHGYYQTNASKIGTSGDFITAPEMSQLFGEMIGMWCISQWMSLGKPKSLDLIEMGPGIGTLMSDILRVAAKFPDFQQAIRVNLVELSDSMRSKQKKTLKCTTILDTTVSKKDDNVGKGDVKTGIERMQSESGVHVNWFYSLSQVPDDKDVPTLIVAQELLDAFPVHQFEYRSGSWRERLVDVCNSTSSDNHFRLVLSPGATPATKALLQGAEIGANIHDNSNSSSNSSRKHQEGESLEVSPLALATCEQVAMKICRTGGAGLFVDYGENYAQPDTLRGFKRHKQVNSMSEPGVVDITADVDFAACARAAVKRGATALGAIPQGEFLVRMGIVDRVQAIINQPNVNDEDAMKLLASLRQLIDNRDMGRRFKVLALYDSRNDVNTIGFPSVNV